jgi:hypothetical protein
MSFPSQPSRSKAYRPLFLLPRALGNPSQWFTCLAFRPPRTKMIVYLWWFSKMAIITACKKIIIATDTSNLFFKRVWVHFGIPQTISSYRDIRFLNTFWLSLWSLLDTKRTKTISFHPQSDVQIEVVNRMIVHILCMYNSKYLCTWDESLPYVQHNYNKDLHSSTNHSPFQVGLGFQPLGPIDVSLPLATTQEESSHVQSEADKATRLIERIQQIRQQVHEILQKSNAKYKQRTMINTRYYTRFKWETRYG